MIQSPKWTLEMRSKVKSCCFYHNIIIHVSTLVRNLCSKEFSHALYAHVFVTASTYYQFSRVIFVDKNIFLKASLAVIRNISETVT
ncbi:CLUMA_CG008786, isoform A [Clunio marinus]|uniref:CLUMA_CG008786, isoform A n=1 Tax=Clunio marinus TaxID=568069 RepID=A0A1J1I4J3_9DIPT|nr:CLUMA_CG008786, isoform A [Clunio marinus]